MCASVKFCTVNTLLSIEICTKKKTSPFSLVHVKLVQVSSQAVLVGTEGLVTSVDVDGSGAWVKNTAVAVTTLDQCTVCGHHAPSVLGWRVTQISFTEQQKTSFKLSYHEIPLRK